jgi:hypothetical protein
MANRKASIMMHQNSHIQDFKNGWGFFVDIERIETYKKQFVHICVAKPIPRIKNCRNSFYKLNNVVKRVETTNELHDRNPVVVEIAAPRSFNARVSNSSFEEKIKFNAFVFGSLCISGILYIILNW